MKKFKITSVAFFTSILILMSIFYSCKQKKDLDKSFYGGIIVGKCQNGWPEYFLTVKKKDSTFVTVKVLPSYYEFYHSGDTIK